MGVRRLVNPERDNSRQLPQPHVRSTVPRQAASRHSTAGNKSKEHAGPTSTTPRFRSTGHQNPDDIKPNWNVLGSRELDVGRVPTCGRHQDDHDDRQNRRHDPRHVVRAPIARSHNALVQMYQKHTKTRPPEKPAPRTRKKHGTKHGAKHCAKHRA
jgi:hypothetical protein